MRILSDVPYAKIKFQAKFQSLCKLIILKWFVKRSEGETKDLVVELTLPGVTPEMIDWWWDNMENTEVYKLWHPKAHISFKWEIPPGAHGHVGAIQITEEKIGPGPSSKLRIRWEDPSTVPIHTTYSHVCAGGTLDKDNNIVSLGVHEYEAEPGGTKLRTIFRLPAKMPSFLLKKMRQSA